MRRPFIVYALPRSRTAWMARFLSYSGWRCHHEIAVKLREVGDIAGLFAQPNTGAAETAAAPAWQIIRHHVPDIRTVVVRRPVDEVVASMLAIDLGSEFSYDAAKLRANMERVDRAIRKASAEPGALVLDYADLDREDGCAALFEHCLPYRFQRSWWEHLRSKNVQVRVADVLRYYHANRDAVERFKRLLHAELRALASTGAVHAVKAA